MVLSIKSQSFHDTLNEIETKTAEGEVKTRDDVAAIVKARGESIEDFKAAHKEYRASQAAGETEFRSGEQEGGWGTTDRIVGRAVGDLGRAVLNLADAVTPEGMSDAVSKAAESVGEYIPDTFKEEFDQIFDPYHGEVDSIEQTVGEIGSFIIPVGAGIRVANGVMRGVQYVSPMMRRFLASSTKTSKIAKAAGWGVAAGIGEGIIEEGSGTAADPKAGDYLQRMPEDALWGMGFGLGAGGAGVVAKKALKKSKKYVKKSKVADLISRNMGSRRGTDDQVLQSVIQRDAAGEKALAISQGLNNDLQKALKASGVQLTPDFLDDIVNGALNGDPQAMRALRNQVPDAGRIVNKMRKSIDKLSKFTSKKIAKGELKASIDSNLGLYLNRSYEAFDNPTFRNNLKGRIKNRANSDQIITNARTWAKRELAGRHGAATDEQVDRFLLDLVEDKNIDGGGALEAISGKLGATSHAMKKKGDLPKELREFYGEIKNPYSNYSKTFEKLSKIKAEYDFLADMRDHLLNTGAMKKAADRTLDDDNFVKASDVMNKRLGAVFGKGNLDKGNIRNPLEGLYVDKSYGKFMRDGLDGIFDTPKGTKNVGALAVLGRTWLRAKSLSQAAKTVYNPATHMANTVGQSAILLANGIVPLGKGAGKALSATMHKVAGKTDAEMGKYLGRASELGITDSGVTVSMIKKNMKEGGGDPLKFMEKSIMGRVVEGAKRPHKALMSVYQAEDDVFKLIHWEKTKDYLKKAHPEKKMREIEEMAAQRTRDMMPNYPMAGRLVQGARALPVGDFISFPAEMIRTTGNMLKYTAADAASGNKTLMVAAAKRLAGMTAIGSIPAIAQNYSRNAQGITPEQEDAINQTLPPYQAYGNRIYMSKVDKDKNGHIGLDMITLNSLDPYDYLKTMGKELHQAALGDTPPDVERAKKALIANQIETFIGPSMLTKAMGKMLEGQSMSDAVGAEDTIGAAIKLAVEPFKPGFANWIDRRNQREKSIDKFGKDGYSSKSHSTITEEMTGVPSLFGVGERRHDITAGLNYNIAPHISKAMKAGKDFTMKLKDPNLSPGDNDLRGRFIRSQKDKLNAQQNLHVLMNAYRELGMSDDDVFQALKTNKAIDISDSKLNLLYRSEDNYFDPFYIGEEDVQYMDRFSGPVVDVDELHKISKSLDGTKVMPQQDEED